MRWQLVVRLSSSKFIRTIGGEANDFYEWVDRDTGVVLKLVSLDRGPLSMNDSDCRLSLPITLNNLWDTKRRLSASVPQGWG